MVDAPSAENALASVVLPVPVSQEDIGKGKKFCFGTCPIANAIMRMPGVVTVLVKACSVRVQMVDNPWAVYYEHTDSTREFISRFDAGMSVEPGTVFLKRRSP